ncbi:MAG: substrate-binding domain-containing protein [Anaerolineaceae bacterium]|nr:substrate-binding domain-containing protein [Anaerolineaceae bacterium]
MSKRILVLVILVLAIVVSLCACQPAEETAAPVAETVDESEEAVEEIEEDGLLIAGVVFQSDTFMQLVQSGIQAAADDSGAELIMGNTENDLAKEGDMIDDYITRGVDAIVITPISTDGSVTALKRAKEAGITIICFNTCVSEEGIADAFLVTKNEDLGLKSGEAAYDFIVNELNGEAKIGLLNCDPFPEACDPRKDGFVNQVSQLPGVEVVADQTGFIADEALPISEAMLQANPDINVLWGANEGGTVAHVLAVQSSGLTGEVFVFGTDMNNQMAQMLQAEDDVLQGVTGQAPYQMGYDAFNLALEVLDKGSVEYNQNTPTIYFGRGNDTMINTFVDTNGEAIFEIPEAVSPEAEAPAQAEETPLIAGVVFQSDTFMQLVQSGIQAGAEALGAELIMGNTENDLAKEGDMIDDYITRGVDAIVITPISTDGSVTALKRAKEAGITIICFNTCVSEEGIADAFLVTKNEDLGLKSGEAAYDFIVNELNGEAKIGLLNCDPFPEACDPRKDGFVNQVSQLPGVEVVADQTGFIADEALPISEAMLQANPDINVLWGANEGGTVAHVLAVQSSGLAGKVFVFGTDMNNQMAQMLQSDDDVLQGVTGQAPYQMGYDALALAMSVLSENTVEYNQNTPTIYFGRGNDSMINKFVDTNGEALFE